MSKMKKPFSSLIVDFADVEKRILGVFETPELTPMGRLPPLVKNKQLLSFMYGGAPMNEALVPIHTIRSMSNNELIKFVKQVGPKTILEREMLARLERGIVNRGKRVVDGKTTVVGKKKTGPGSGNPFNPSIRKQA